MQVNFQKYYFSEGLKWTCVIGSSGLSVYLLFWTSLWWVAPILVFISMIAVSTKYELVIDPRQSLIIDSFYLIWIKTKSEETSFHTLDRITIDKVRHRYTANSRGKTGVTDFNEYIGTLHYDGNKSYEIHRGVDYQDFASDIKPIAERLNLEIERLF